MPPSFAAQAEAIYAQFTQEERQGLGGFEVVDESLPHPFLWGHWLLSELVTNEGGERRIRVYQASFQKIAEGDGDFSSETALAEELARQASRHHEDRACAEAYDSDDALFDAHARFRDGEPLLPGWYRQGNGVQPYAWAVDVDVFIELPLRAPEFEALRGTTVILKLPGADMELDVPADAAPDETWTIEGAGLFEEDPGIDLEALEDDDEVTGTFGDLHVMLLVTEAGPT